MVDDIRALQEAAYSTHVDEGGLSDLIKERYDSAVRNAGKRVWRGMMAVAASGFGKGVMLTALVIVAASALLAGAGVDAGNLFNLVGTDLASAVPMTMEQGIGLGINRGISTLFQGIGMAAMAFGGALGAIADVRKRQNRISEDVARQQAMNYELARQQHIAQEQQVQPDVPPPAEQEYDTTPIVPAPSGPAPQGAAAAVPVAERAPQIIHVSCNPTAVVHHHTEHGHVPHSERELQRRSQPPAQGIHK